MRIDDENKLVVPDFVAEFLDTRVTKYSTLRNLFRDTAEFKRPDYSKRLDMWLTEKENCLTFAKAVMFGYVIEQPKKYYWRKKKEHLAWFEDLESVLVMSKNNDVLRFGYISSYDNRFFKAKFTEKEARDLLKDDFDKFKKVECE